MQRPERPRIVIDSSPLRYLHTGLGQFSFHLLHELSVLPLPEAQLLALVHPNYRALVPPGIGVESANWLRRHAPTTLQSWLYQDCRVWHMTAENTRFTGVPGKARVILTVHGLHFLDEKVEHKAEKELERVQRLVNRAEVITVVSRFTEKLVRARLEIGGRPIHVIYNGVGREVVAAKTPSWAPKGKFLFSVGTFFARKNLHVLIPVMKLLPEYSLVLAGNDSHAYGTSIRQKIESAGLADRILLPGEITDGEKQWLYEWGEALLFPSISEGFGIPVIEAYRLGKPVFCSRLGSLPEVGGSYGYYWNNFEPESMAALILEKLAKESPALSAGRKTYAAEFTWANMAKAYRKIYQGLLD